MGRKCETGLGENYIGENGKCHATSVSKLNDNTYIVNLECLLTRDKECTTYDEEAITPCVAKKYGKFISILAIPCNGEKECEYGEDENERCGGKFSIYYLICGFLIGCLTIFSLLLLSQCYTKELQMDLDLEELPTTLSKKNFRNYHAKKQLTLPMASFQNLSVGKRIKINQDLLIFEKEVHGGNTQEAICCLKVSTYYIYTYV